MCVAIGSIDLTLFKGSCISRLPFLFLVLNVYIRVILGRSIRASHKREVGESSNQAGSIGATGPGHVLPFLLVFLHHPRIRSVSHRRSGSMLPLLAASIGALQVRSPERGGSQSVLSFDRAPCTLRLPFGECGFELGEMGS